MCNGKDPENSEDMHRSVVHP